MGELQKIKHDINSVKSDLRVVERIAHTLSKSAGTSLETNDSGVSVLCIRLKETYDPPLGKLGLEALTKCPIINYVKISGTAYKTKVHM